MEFGENNPLFLLKQYAGWQCHGSAAGACVSSIEADDCATTGATNMVELPSDLLERLDNEAPTGRLAGRERGRLRQSSAPSSTETKQQLAGIGSLVADWPRTITITSLGSAEWQRHRRAKSWPSWAWPRAECRRQFVTSGTDNCRGAGAYPVIASVCFRRRWRRRLHKGALREGLRSSNAPRPDGLGGRLAAIWWPISRAEEC